MNARLVSERRSAILAGLGYLAVFLLALFANFVGREQLIDPGNSAATFSNILESEALFRAGVVAFTIIFLLDIVIAWALYILFRPRDADLSLLTAWFRIVYTILLGVALVSSFMVLDLIGDASHLQAFDQAQIASQVTLHLDSFTFAWLIGLACFGVHLILLGVLVLRAGSAPKIIGVLLGLAGTVYIVDTFANILLPNYEDFEDLFLAIVAIPSLIGELAFAIWLLARGGRWTPQPGSTP